MIDHLTSYPRRIICLTEETTETLYLLGEQERIVGVSGYTVRPPEARLSRRFRHSSRQDSTRFLRWSQTCFRLLGSASPLQLADSARRNP